MRIISSISRNNWLLFGLGIIVSVLFFFFSPDVYENLYYEPSFSNDMYNQGMYDLAAILTLGICWGIAILYYLILEHVFSCYRWYHWLITVILVIILSPSVTYNYTDSYFMDMDLNYEVQERNFAIASAFVSFVIYLIICLCIKGLSRDNSKTPF